jgi:hypothetical protein
VFYIDTRRSICLLSVSLDTRRTSHITDPSCASHPASVHTSPIPYLPPEPYHCSPDLISLIPSFTLDRDLPTALAPYLTAPPLHSLSLDLECRPTATTAVRHPALTRPGGVRYPASAGLGGCAASSASRTQISGGAAWDSYGWRHDRGYRL